MARISSNPDSGRLNIGSVAAITTRLARGTPAMPLLVTISTISIVIICPTDMSMP